MATNSSTSRVDNGEIPELTIVEIEAYPTEHGTLVLHCLTKFDIDKFPKGVKFHLGLSEIGGEVPEFNQ